MDNNKIENHDEENGEDIIDDNGECDEEELPVFEKFTIIPNHPIKKLDENYENFDLLVDLNVDTGATILTGTKVNDTSGKKYALKIIEKAKIADDKLKIARLKREVKIYNKTRYCKHVVDLHEIIETDYDLTFVMDYIDGGQLFDKVAKTKGMRLSEEVASKVVRQLTESIKDLHTNGVCHRDLKPENILCTSGDDFDLKLIDFGLAKFIKIDNGEEILKASTSGTLAYVAPERFDSNDTKAIDIWSIGIIMYFVLFGNTPFCDLTQDQQDEEEVFKKITTAPLKLPPKVPISKGAKEVLAGCLKRDPKQRWTCQKILEHSWTQGEIHTVFSKNKEDSQDVDILAEEDIQKLKASMSMVINASRDIQDNNDKLNK